MNQRIRRVLKWDPDDPDRSGAGVDFRLTYDGPLYAYNVRRDEELTPKRAEHIFNLRRRFHSQLRTLWQKHPALAGMKDVADFKSNSDGFDWQVLVPSDYGLMCKLEILMLRDGPPGRVMTDIDNRLKTVFDALRKARNPREVAEAQPGADETPFFVLLENDDLITHVAVTTEMLLEPVPNTPRDDAVRLVISATVKPYLDTWNTGLFI